jgi:hypothetical protein
MLTLRCADELVAGVRTGGDAIPNRASRATTAAAASVAAPLTTSISTDYRFCDRN